MSVTDVLAGERRWWVEQGDCLPWLSSLPDDSVDLVLFSPPYEKARLYLESGQDLGVARDTDAWVAWMVEVFRACRRVCKGLVACVCEGQTRNYRWSASPVLLMAELHRAGFHLRKPPAYHRVGIPGSGGPDWLRNDYEFVVCTTRGGKLPWSDNTAMGHPPKWAPGGEMSHRLSDGQRVNQWGKCGTEAGVNGVAQRTRDGGRQKASRPSHKMRTKGGSLKDGIVVREVKMISARNDDGTRDDEKGESYVAPVLANPGNVISVKVGGGLMGHALAHENEAPYPLTLAAFFVRSFCQPRGVVCDPFSGSGTTGHAAIEYGRRFVGCDLRESQVDLSRRRIGDVTPPLFD